MFSGCPVSPITDVGVVGWRVGMPISEAEEARWHPPSPPAQEQLPTMTEALQRGPYGPAPPLCVPPPPPPEAKSSKRSKKKRKEPTPEPVPTVRSSRRIAGDAAAAAADRRAPPLPPRETQSEATTAASPSRAEIMASENTGTRQDCHSVPAPMRSSLRSVCTLLTTTDTTPVHCSCATAEHMTIRHGAMRSIVTLLSGVRYVFLKRALVDNGEG